MSDQHTSFRTYRETGVSPAWEETDDHRQAAALERERAQRYMDQAANAVRLAGAALDRASGYDERHHETKAVGCTFAVLSALTQEPT